MVELEVDVVDVLAVVVEVVAGGAAVVEVVALVVEDVVLGTVLLVVVVDDPEPGNKPYPWVTKKLLMADSKSEVSAFSERLTPLAS